MAKGHPAQSPEAKWRNRLLFSPRTSSALAGWESYVELREEPSSPSHPTHTLDSCTVYQYLCSFLGYGSPSDLLFGAEGGSKGSPFSLPAIKPVLFHLQSLCQGSA